MKVLHASVTSTMPFVPARFAAARSVAYLSPERFREAVPGGFVSREDLQLVQGTLDVLVLKTVSWGAAHGYAIARWIRDATEGELEVEDRALYVSLHRLEARGQLESDWGLSENNRRAKYYQLTATGRRELKREQERWRRYAAAVSRVLDTAPAG